jgi:hypothetical protein
MVILQRLEPGSAAWVSPRPPDSGIWLSNRSHATGKPIRSSPIPEKLDTDGSPMERASNHLLPFRPGFSTFLRHHTAYPIGLMGRRVDGRSGVSMEWPHELAVPKIAAAGRVRKCPESFWSNAICLIGIVTPVECLGRQGQGCIHAQPVLRITHSGF